MENAQQTKPELPAHSSIRPFSFGKFILGMIAGFFVDFVLAIITLFVLAAASGFDIHGDTSSTRWLPAYIIINIYFLAYATSKGRDSASGFFIGALISTLLAWGLIN
ncbi:MAG: hypothetical protein WKG07_07070 [Hymenobacter sp.]